jgi:hypothetical protein
MLEVIVIELKMVRLARHAVRFVEIKMQAEF